MPSITFDQPSQAAVESDQAALFVKNGADYRTGNGTAIHGWAKCNAGIYGESFGDPGRLVPLPSPPLDLQGVGVAGRGSNTGVIGTSTQGSGVIGLAAGTLEPGHGPTGVLGRTNSGSDSGVWGDNTGSGIGVTGTSAQGGGVFGQGGFNGVHGVTANSSASGVWGENTGGGNGVGGKSASGVGVYGTGSPAGHFDGDVEVTGDIRLTNQDCAEDFEMQGIENILPGSVVVIDSAGALKQSDRAYDRRVAGVISGAGDCKPGIILGRQRAHPGRMPVALVGKVYCRVDASYSPIDVGDLLTTSATPGHAMKAADHLKAFGAVIGKALSTLESGQGLIPILVALQ